MEIVDTATIIYNEKDITTLGQTLDNIKAWTSAAEELEKNKYIFRNVNIKDYEFINFISVTELKKSIRVSISFSYSRYENKDSYNLCTRERTVSDVHTKILKAFRIITSKFLKYDDLEIGAIDISNQLKVSNIKEYYKILDLIYKSLKLQEQNGRMYFDVNKDKRKTLDGIDFREAGKKRRESNTYFKIYSKRKEQQQTGKVTRGKSEALRGELTLKGKALKYHGLTKLNSITKDNLNRILNKTIGQTLKSLIQEELNQDIKFLQKKLKHSKTKRIREEILINEYRIFDLRILDSILVPQILGVGERMCRNHKKAIKELLHKTEQNGEIKKDFKDNITKLKRLLKEIAKIELEIDITEEGVNIWEKRG